MVRANQSFDLPPRGVANHRATVPADIVQRPRLAPLIPRDNDRIRIEFDGEIVATVRNLTRVPGKKPTRPPHALAVKLVQLLIGIKLSQQAAPGGLASE